MKKPIVLVIMDGVGKGDGGSGDAVAVANTPNLDKLFATCPPAPACRRRKIRLPFPATTPPWRPATAPVPAALGKT